MRLPWILSTTGSCLLLAACGGSAGTAEAWSAPILYSCSVGKTFEAEFRGRQVKIITRGGSRVMDERPSSIGRRFGSPEAAFMKDDDRGVLTGLPDGPYRRCTSSGHSTAALLPGSSH